MEQKSKNKKSKGELWVPGLKPSRIEALTDGVFAIAMTILVLELAIPNFIGMHTAGEEVPRNSEQNVAAAKEAYNRIHC